MLKKLLSGLAALLLSAGASYALFYTSVDRLVSGNASFPVMTSCGTNTLSPGSSDFAGEVQVGAVTTCTLTFGTAYATAPSCVVSEETVNTATKAVTVSATAITITGLTSASKISYVCVAKAGG